MGFQALHVLANRGYPRAAARLARMTPRGDQMRLRTLALTWHLDGGDAVPVSQWKSVCNLALGALDQELAMGTIHPRVTWEVLQLLFHPRIQQGPRSPILHDGLNMQSLLIHPVIHRLAGLNEAHAVPRQLSSEEGGDTFNAELSDVSPQLATAPTLLDFADVQARTRGATLPQRASSNREESGICEEGKVFHLLIVTDVNTTFIQPAVDWWGKRGVEVRVRNVAEDGLLRRWCAFSQTVTDRLTGVRPDIPDSLVADMAWADTVWVEWCSGLAARLSGARLEQVGHPRLVVRLHRFETLTPAPLLTQWCHVDALVVVAPFIPAMMAGATPAAALNALRGRVEVVGNAWEPRHYQLEKTADATHTVALIGWGAPVKDAPWAAGVVRELQRRQPEANWTLLLVGAAPTRPEYRRRCQEAFASLKPGSVVQTGHTDDVPRILQRAGVIVSSSHIESQHMGLLEGAASGCIPVVRNWPDVADLAIGDRRTSGARTVYPDPWVVDTPVEGAMWVLRALENSTLDPVRFAQARGSDAVMPELDRIIGRVVKNPEG